jgi:aspartate aminotransferase
MGELSNYGENIIGSEILKISGKIKSKTEKVYNYTIGDFDSQLYNIPKKLNDYIQWNFNISNTNYPTPVGELSLREGVSLHLKRKHFINYSPNQILIGAGVRPLIYTIFKTIINKGDDIIIPVPSWNNNHYTFLHDGMPIVIECSPENDFFPTAEQIKDNVKNAKMICLCSPQNPTGKIIKPDVLKDICQIIVDENKRRLETQNIYKPLYLFFDQIYSDLSRIETHHPIKLVPEIKDYLVCVDGISKSLAATGVRVGWMFGPEHLIKKAGEIFSHIGAWANKPEQIAVSEYLSTNVDDPYFGIDTFLSARNNTFGQICDGICDVLQDMKSTGYKVDFKKPDGAIYISVYLGYINKFNDLEQMLDFLIDDCKVGLVPFEYFGSTHNKGWFRLSIGTIKLKDLSEHQEVIKNMIKKLADK